MQYWINHNGVQSGPVDLDGIKEMGLTSRAYVWHEGLADWVKITQLPDLQGLYEMVTEETGQADPAGASSDAVMGQPYQPYQPQPQPAFEQRGSDRHWNLRRKGQPHTALCSWRSPTLLSEAF